MRAWISSLAIALALLSVSDASAAVVRAGAWASSTSVRVRPTPYLPRGPEVTAVHRSVAARGVVAPPVGAATVHASRRVVRW
jgi:hypothetical protein